eukprot:scaffold1565_cov221-Amphora_coffeaeformis.AAC.13
MSQSGVPYTRDFGRKKSTTTSHMAYLGAVDHNSAKQSDTSSTCNAVSAWSSSSSSVTGGYQPAKRAA